MSPHGGKREGAGRPTVEKKTANLCGVRITVARLAAYREAALRAGLSLTDWVELHLDKAART